VLDEKAKTFFQLRAPLCRNGLYQEDSVNHEVQLLHSHLLRSTFDVPPLDVQRRRASISLDGTPIVYSLKLLRQDSAPAFRMLVEPGGLGVTVPEQIDYSLRTIDTILHKLGWESSIEDLNAIITRVFPPDASAVLHWWGGMWLGMAFSTDHLELRLYLNLRHEEATARWQRLANVLGWFGDLSLEVPLQALIQRVAPHAIPVGLGVVVSKRVCGFRIYVGMHTPSLDTILIAGPERLAGAAQDITFFCNSFTKTFGPFARQSVTLGYDFLLEETGILRPLITRTKIDVSCEFLSASDVFPWFDYLLSKWDFDVKQSSAFFKDLQICFGGAQIEYVSLGCREGIDHITVYAKPDGYKQK
jgi:hypothetical protein